MILIRLAKFVTAGFLAVVPFVVLPSDAVADPTVTVLAFGLVGSQSVFESEAKGAAAILAQRLGAGAADVVVRANTKTRGDVTIAAIGAALQSAAARLDHDNDLLVLVRPPMDRKTASPCRPAGACKSSRRRLSPPCSTVPACGTAW